MMEHLVPVCHATSIPIGGCSKLGSRTTLLHAHSTTPEIVVPSLCSVTHPEEYEGFEKRGEVPLIRNGRRTHETLDRLTLRDLPAILDTLVVLEEEHQRREHEEAERKTAERKKRESLRAKERRKLKKLGEW
jgi:hypothetical protein